MAEMKTVVIAAFLIALCSEPSFSVKDTQMCLTWNATDESLVLKCKVSSLEYKLVLLDAFNIIRVECFKNQTPSCAKIREDDMIFEKNTENGFSIVFHTDKNNEDGDWQCNHGSNEAHVNINLSKGTAYSTDLDLSGEIMEMKEYRKFKLTCSSCWTPHLKSVYFFVNDVFEDNILVSGGKCYHKRELCNITECTCSMDGNTFTWSYISDLSFLKFSCEMRFKDQETSTLSIQMAHVIYNETGFNYEAKGTKTIAVSNKDKYVSIGNPVENEIDSADGKEFGETYYIFVCTLAMIVAISVATLSCAFPDIPGRIKKSISRCFNRIQTDKKWFKKRDFCFTCMEFSVCGVCLDCKRCYCDTCCTYHLKKHEEHQVCQIQNVTNGRREMICKTCLKLAKQICRTCWELCCTVCAKRHIKHGQPIFINQPPLESKQQKSKDPIEKLRHIYSMPIKDDDSPVRICGIGYLEIGEKLTLVALDRNNKKLIIFNEDGSQLPNKELHEEPCALATTTGDKIAVTFPYIMQIRIYEINLETITLVDQIDICSLRIGNLKPFSIAYDNKHFAVEVGEGEDGIFIIILASNKNTLIKTVSCNFAYFTGHTIRLALQIKDTCTDDDLLYVSAMSKKMIYCINFKGEQLWHTSIPSPRSIVVLDDASIILSSRRCNAIYKFTKKPQPKLESVESLETSRNISSPRYMAYHKNRQLLCVLVVNEQSHKDEFVVFEFMYDQPSQETKLIEDTIV